MRAAYGGQKVNMVHDGSCRALIMVSSKITDEFVAEEGTASDLLWSFGGRVFRLDDP